VSGPQIVEGWYGEPWGRPYWRLRDYIEIMRKIFDRDAPVEHQGREISLPYTGEGSIGLGKPLRSILHTNPRLPIWLGSGSEATVKLTAELCDGWLPMHFVPGRMEHYRPWVEEGFRRSGGKRSWDNFEIQASAAVILTDDRAEAVQAGFQRQKMGIALYVGGMGHASMNFHNQHMTEQGYGDAAARIQELFLEGRKDEAAATVPDEYVDERALVGPASRIKARFRDWADSGLTGLTINTHAPAVLELMADLAKLRAPA
jgi:F420-dependent oxidoreductase-like protein